MTGSLALAGDPIDNTDEFIQKMAHEGDSQDSDIVTQGGNNAPIEWGDDTVDPDKKIDIDQTTEETVKNKNQAMGS